jgi:hypothetical protein
MNSPAAKLPGIVRILAESEARSEKVVIAIMTVPGTSIIE